MPKICITMALLCFTLLVQPDSIKARPDSNSRYLLIELEGSPNMDPGSDVTTELSKVSEMPEAEEEPSDDLEPETLPEKDDEIYLKQTALPATNKPEPRRLNLKCVTPPCPTGYRSSN